MTSSLKLVGSKILNSGDSNVSSNFTLPASSSGNWNGIFNTAHVHRATNSGYTDQVYYSWYAATAGTGNTSLSDEMSASSSICPKGWRLPKGGTSSEYKALYDKYNSYDAMKPATVPNFTLSGYYGAGNEEQQGEAGYYWTSTSRGPGTNPSTFYAYSMRIDNSSFGPNHGYGQHYAFTVRCLAP